MIAMNQIQDEIDEELRNAGLEEHRAYFRSLIAAARELESIKENRAAIDARVASMAPDEKERAVGRLLRFAFSPDLTHVGKGEPENLPDSDTKVVAVNHEGDYVIVELEFTDDSEGHGEPYWAADGGDLALCNYPHWMPLPSAPEQTKEKANG